MNSVIAIADRVGAALVQSDLVSKQRVAVAVRDMYAIRAVAGNYVALAGSGPSDQIARCTEADGDAVFYIAEGGGAGGVGANQVALDGIAGAVDTKNTETLVDSTTDRPRPRR